MNPTSMAGSTRARPCGRFVVVCLSVAGLAAGPGIPAAETGPPRRLTVAEAERLVADDRELVLNVASVQELTPDVARVLARCRSVLVLSGLSEISPDVAAALAECPAALDLSGLKSLSPECWRALAAYRGPHLDLAGIRTVPPEVAAFARTMPVRLFFSARGRPGLTAAEAEAQVRKADWNGDVSGLWELSAGLASRLAAAPHWNGLLPNIVAIQSPDSVAIATALAGRKGRLFLPNLTIISPKTLTALIEKEDVEIPPIEYLELIDEPDGSPTEDFVIPKEFERRRR